MKNEFQVVEIPASANPEVFAAEVRGSYEAQGWKFKTINDGLIIFFKEK